MRRFLLLTAMALILLGANMAAFADAGGIPHWSRTGDLDIGVGSDLGSATWEPDQNGWTWENVIDPDTGLETTIYTYVVTSPIELRDPSNNNLIAWIDNLTMQLDQDPQVKLNFACTSGAAVTTFSFASFLDTTLINPRAKASASVTVTDNDGVVAPNYATVTGLWGGDIYEARYNAGTVFQDLITGPLHAGSDYSSNTASETYGWVYGLGGVNRMEAEYKFTLSANDQASGTSTYIMIDEVIPEPSSLLAMASGLLPIGLLIRRRR